MEPVTQAFVRALPKAELHVHVEGTLEPELAFRLARRNGVRLRYPDATALRAAYEFEDLQSFLDVYYEVASVLLEEQDFRDLAGAYLERAAADGVVRAEIFFDPQTHTDRGVPLGTVIRGLARALDEGRERLGVSGGLILCFLRHLSPEAALRTLELALPFRDHLLGVGLDSSERDHPPGDFRAVFDRARREGLHAVAHAGEEGPPEYVRQALDVLGAERIDHGVRSEEDPDLLDRLAREGVPLTVCPLSNVKLRVFDDLAAHNLARLLERGLRVSIHSDDPAYFGGYVADNYLAAARALGLGRDDLVRIARNSLESAFVAEGERAPWLAALEATGS